GFGASVTVAGVLSSALSVLFTRISSVLNAFLFLKPAQLCCALHAARHAAASASRCAAISPRSPRHAQSAFRLSRQSPSATHSAADSARKNIAPARTAPRALSSGSPAPGRQTPEVVPATGTYRLPGASNASLPAYVCATLHPAPQAAKRTPCA